MTQNRNESLLTTNLYKDLEAHHEAAFGWAMACCGRNVHEAEEVLQTAYLKIADGRAVYGNGSSFRTWLFGVIRNTARDMQRKSVLKNAFLGLLKVHQNGSGPEEADSPEDHASRSQDREHVKKALAVLSKRQQEVLHLVFYQDMTLEEAAKVMSVSVGSARKHYARGKEAVRKRIEAAGGDHEQR